ncbi:alanine racemase [Agromyces albus]|uniref:Amino acid deaminase n=1 Tax=Agromyces albus TaxID=205332 RepID=A0A4Q2L2C3_9MICO|nr:alanine racemase [Agromyces albus]RXZ72255.1 amino acid deaminase [Agromyces albus]
MPQPRVIAELAEERLEPSDKGLPARAAGLTVREFLASGPRLSEFWTPLLVLDEQALAHNAAVIQEWATSHGFDLMPHGKTTMAPALWQRQLDAGAAGLTLATPWQVRTARSFGVARIMLANTLVAPAGLAFIASELADEGFAFSCWADSVATVEAMKQALPDAPLPRPIDVLVELGAAGGRTGARSLDEAVGVAQRIAASRSLRLAGVAGYEGSLGHDRSPAALAAVRDYLGDLLELRAAVRPLVGDRELIVTAGGSAYLDVVADVFAPAMAADAAAGLPASWILRSGASLLHDDGFYHGISPLDAGAGADARAGAAARSGGATLISAMRGYARVVSHPEPGLALLDGGKRDFPYDEGLPVPFGRAARLGADEEPLVGASVTAVNDQHAFLRSDAALPVSIGDVVSLGLSHPCTAFDKWRWIPVVEHRGSDRVVDLVRTFF